MNGPDLTAGPAHYRRAEQLLKYAVEDSAAATAALGHALLAKVALDAETRVDTLGHRLVVRPRHADPDMDESAFPGSLWGRALYGDQP